MMRKQGVVELLVTSDGSIGLNDAARFLPQEGLLVCVVLEYVEITMCQPLSTWEHSTYGSINL